MKKILCFVFSLVLIISAYIPAYRVSAEETAGGEKVVFDFNCDSFDNSPFTASSGKYPECYIAESKSAISEPPEAGTIIFGSNDDGQDQAYIAHSLSLENNTFSLALRMNIESLQSPGANIAWRGFVFDIQIPGNKNIYIAFNKMTTSVDNDGNNACVTVMKSVRGEDGAETKNIKIPTDGKMHDWNILYDGSGRLKIITDGVLQAYFTDITLACNSSEGYLRIANSMYDRAAGNNRIIIDNIKLTEGVMFDEINIDNACIRRGSDSKKLYIDLINRIGNVKDEVVAEVTVTCKSDPSKSVTTTVKSVGASATAEFDNIPFYGMCTVSARLISGDTESSKFTFVSYFNKAYSKIDAGAELVNNESGNSYYFDKLYKVYLDENSVWKKEYIKDTETGEFGTVLVAGAENNVSEFIIPAKLSGKFAVYAGYQVGTEGFCAGGNKILLTYPKEASGEVYEKFAYAADFPAKGDLSNSYVKFSNYENKPARLVYVKFVSLSDEQFSIYTAEDKSKKLMIDNDGYTGFFLGNYPSTNDLCEKIIKRYAQNADIGQYNFCTLVTSKLNFDSVTAKTFVEKKLTELGISKDKWPTDFLDSVNAKGEKENWESNMRDGDKLAFEQIRNINKTAFPHKVLADYATANSYGEVYGSLRMSAYYGNTDGYLDGSIYYLNLSEWQQKDGTQLSFYYEGYRQYMHDLLVEIATTENIAGVTLDFGRYPYIFGNELQDVAERTKIMNAFMKQLRDDIPADKKINVRILIPTDSRAINYGLDYITWVKNGYIDRLITSDQSYESFSSFDEFVKLCADNKCEYYLGIVSDVAGHDLTKEEEALMKQGLLKPSNIKTNLYTSEFILRGYEGYAKGADGIFVFNGICTEKDDFVDPMFQYLNNKTEAMKWYEFEYPSYSAFYLTEAATAVPEEISGFTPEKPAVSNVPDNTKNINPIWWIAGAAGIIIITLTAILISKKKTGKTGKSK